MRLTNQVREEIKQRVIDTKITTQINALNKANNSLVRQIAETDIADRVEYREYQHYLEMSEYYHAKINEVNIMEGGNYIGNFILDEIICPVGFGHGWHGRIMSINVEDKEILAPYYERFKENNAKIDVLKIERKELSDELHKVLYSVNTSDQLINLWEGVTEYFDFNEKKLPSVISIDRLTELLGGNDE